MMKNEKSCVNNSAKKHNTNININFQCATSELYFYFCYDMIVKRGQFRLGCAILLLFKFSINY